MTLPRDLIRGVLIVALTALFAGASFAEEKSPTEPTTTPAVAEDSEPLKLEMEDVEIRGELERPEVFYIIPRRKAQLDLGSMHKDYSPSLMAPLKPSDFERLYGGD